MECPTDINDFLDFDIPAFTSGADCKALYAAIAIAELHIVKISVDPCAFDELEFAGVKCSGAEKIRRITALIESWYRIIKCKVSMQHMHRRKRTKGVCRPRCKGKPIKGVV